MERQVEVHGQRLRLYKVRGYDNAWCSDPHLGRQIERKREQFMQELRAAAKDIETMANVILSRE